MLAASSQPNVPSPVNSGPRAFAEAGIKPSAGEYVSIYDSFPITGLITWKISSFYDKGQGGKLVADGNLILRRRPAAVQDGRRWPLLQSSSQPRWPDKVVAGVRQLRGAAYPRAQVKNCDIALAHRTDGSLATQHGNATLIMGRSDE